MPFNSGYRGTRANDTTGIIGPQVQYLQKSFPKPFITGYSVQGSDDTALNPAGGQTVVISGGNFATGVSAILDGTQIGSVTLVSPSQLTFTAPAKASGSYSLVVYNPVDSAAAILVPGLIYSGIPTWTTAAGSIGSYYETTAINTSVVATSDSAITYAVTSGTIPTGSTFYANGVLTGTAPVDSGSTTYTFAVTATDAELQDTTRTFTVTVNTDVVTWVNPSSGATINLDGTAYSNVLSATDAAGYSISSYTANALPTGLSLAGNTISGTPTVDGTSTTLLTATAATTNRSATNTITWVVSLGDAYFDYVTTLLSASTPSPLPFNDDASTNNFAVTINGDTRPYNFNPYTPGYYSNYFDGTGDYLTVPNDTALQFGTGDFTVEFWAYVTGGSSWRAFVSKGTASTGWSVIINDTGYWAFSDTSSNYGGSIAVVNNSWTHVAFTRSGTTVKLFVNGVQAYSTTLSTNYSQTDQLVIGAGRDTTIPITGYMADVRIVKGTAVYTSAFTPPTSPLTAISGTSLLTCQSNRFIDNSTNNFTITKNGDTSVKSFNPYTPSSSYSTYGSTYFDGTGDYLSIGSNALLAPGTSDFTYESWIYPLALAQGTSSGATFFYVGTNGLQIGMTSTNQGNAWGVAAAGTAWLLYSTTKPTLNSWNHIAVTRSSGTVRLFLNGTLLTSTANSTNFATGALNIGYGSVSGDEFNGYMTNVRFVKGTALYTSNFTPPTSPLTAITNTSLLTCQSNQPVNNNVFLDNSTSNFAITRNGNTTQGTFSPYGSNWSYYFGSSTNAGLQYAYNSANGAILAQGTAYTLEGWFYITTAASGNTVSTSIPIACSSASSASTASGHNWSFGSTTFGWYDRASSVWLTISWTPPLNQWFHLALVATNGTSFVLYINGTSVGTATDNTSYFADSGYSFYLGSVNGNGTNTANGLYISNLRYSKTAVYSTTFTPSTTPLQPLASTTILTAQSPNFADKSPYNPVVTKPFAGTNSVQKFGPFSATTLPTPYYSTYFDGSSYVTVANNGGTITTGVFTLEFWVYPTSISNGPIPVENYTWSTGYNAGWHTIINSNGTVALVASTGVFNASTTIITSTGTVSINTWSHIAYVRDSNNVITVYINGVNSGTTTYSASLNQSYGGASPVTRFGSHLADGAVYNGLSGFISNLRLVIGTAVYTSGFTPPTSPLTAISGTTMLVCQSNTQIDNSSNANTLTPGSTVKPLTISPFTLTYSTSQSYTPSVYGGSAYFDGSSDSLALTTTTPLVMNTYPFTMEAWVYPTSYAHGFYIIESRTYNGVGTGTYSLYVSTAGAVLFDQVQTPTTIITTASSAVPLNVWTHIAVVRNSSNVWYLYVNGVSSGTTAPTNAFDFSSTNTTYIGYNSDTSNWSAYGYISDVRVIKGQALYTSNFVPLNAPLQPVKNTTLLVNSTNSGIYDSSEMNNFESVANAKISTTVAKFSGTTSMSFDGSSWLYNNVGLLDFGTGDFTIEFWVYRNNTGNGYLFRSGGSSINASVGQFGLYFESSNTTLTWQKTAGTTVQWTVSSSSITANNWFFITVVRQSGVFKVFYDGVSQSIVSGSFTDSTSYSCVQPSVGGNFTNYNFNGYISDFRVTKGIARYTSNFTAPTSPFKRN